MRLNDKMKTDKEELGIVDSFKLILKNSKIVAGCTLIGAIISVAISFFLIKLPYSAELMINFALPSYVDVDSAQIYISDNPLLKYTKLIKQDSLLTQIVQEYNNKYPTEKIDNKLGKKLIGTTLSGSQLTIMTRSDSLEKAQSLLSIVYKNFINHTEMEIKKKGVPEAIEKKEKELNDLLFQYQEAEKIFNESKDNILNKSEGQLVADSENNLFYYDILKYRLSIRLVEEHIKKLQFEQELLNRYIEKHDESAINLSHIEIVDKYIDILSRTQYGATSVSAQIVKQIFLGGMVGLLVGTTVVLLNEFALLKKKMIEKQRF